MQRTATSQPAHSSISHLLEHFGPSARLGRLTTGAVEAYKTTRLAAGAKPATVNRDLAALRRMAGLARHQDGLVVPFVVELLEERNVRTGFFEEDAFRAVCRRLRRELAALASVAQITGWRKGELVSRQWRHVDFAAGWLRLEPEETRNGDGRQFPLIPELRAVLESQRARVEAIQKTTGQLIPWGSSAGTTGRRSATSGRPGQRRRGRPACQVASSTTSGGRQRGT